MRITLSEHRQGFLFVSISAVAWSTGGVFTRLVSVDSATMLAWRGLFGALGLAVAMMAMRQRGAWRAFRNMGWTGWLFVAQASAGMIFYIAALRRTSVANVAVIYATAPFLAAALSWLVMREKPSPSAVIASLIALIGVAVMVGFGSPGGLLGDLLAFGMTCTMAITMVVARNFRDIPVLPAACLSSLITGILCWPFGTPMAASGHDILMLVLFGVINFAIGLPLFTLGARHLPAIETALIGAMDAPLAPLWVWLICNEVPGTSTFIGGAVVFAAVGVHLLLSEARGAGRGVVAQG